MTPLRGAVFSATVGLELTILPELADKYFGNGSVFGMLDLPGTLGALIVSGWRIHDVDHSLVLLVNFVFYSVITYAILMIWRSYKRKHLAKVQC